MTGDAGKHRDLGLLILRIGIGGMFVAHGLPKMLGGPAKWQAVGHAMDNLGIHFAPTLWGFMAALSELGGGLLLASGVLFQPACLMLLFTMCVATLQHVHKGDSFATLSHAAEAAILFLSLFLIGPGPWRLRIGR